MVIKTGTGPDKSALIIGECKLQIFPEFFTINV